MAVANDRCAGAGSPGTSSGASFSMRATFSLGRQSLYFCRFFRKHLLARLRIARKVSLWMNFINPPGSANGWYYSKG